MLTTGHITGYSLKRNPIGGSNFNKDALEMDSKIMCDKSKPMEKHFNKHVKDKRTIYTEPSRFSSSSPAHSTSQQDTLLFDPLILPENSSTRPRTRQHTTSTELYRQPYYLQEVDVKDSMQQEPRKQPSKTKGRDNVSDSLAKQKNTQRTLVQHEGTYEPAVYGRNELKEHSRSKEVSFFSISKDDPRFSYYEKMVLHNPSFKQRDVSQYQDMVRLSLDSKESSTRRLKPETKTNLFTNPSRNNHQQNSGTHIRSPSVVAKLMGLEALPNSSVSYNESKTSSVEPCRPTQVFVQSKILSKESNSPRWKTPGSTIKPVSSLPVEPAPWKQVDRPMKDSVKMRNSFPSVYSEIEKRLKDLEFSQSGKDLRALKQILEAMQEKQDEEENPRFLAEQKGHGRKNNTNVMPTGSTSPKPQNELIYSFTKQGGNFSRNYESPIVIMKPAKHNGKSDYPMDELSSDMRSNNRVSKTIQTSTKSLQPGKNGNTSSFKSNESISLKNKQKKPESEKRSGGASVPLTDSRRSRTRSNKQGKHGSNYSSNQRNDEDMSEISSESTNLSSHENDNSAQSDGIDIKATSSSERSLDMINRNPFTKTLQNSVTCLIDKESTFHGLVVMENPEIAPEYPSPVSVLDNILDIDDSSPSPIQHEDKINRDYETRDSGILPSSEQHKEFSDSIGTGFPFEFNRKKLKNIENLVQKLQSVNSSHDEARTDYIASLCENTNPDHRYISEILLASGILLSDIGSNLTNFQFHSSGHPINPGLFLVLEQTKASSFLDYPPEKNTILTTHLRTKQKIHRKVIFDTINEVLARKFVPLEHQPFCLKSQKLTKTTLNTQKLLKELCLEMDELQSVKTNQSSENNDDELRDILREDVMNPSEGWLDNMNKVSGIVLDIERLVFKDLVDEVLVGETPCLKNNSSRRRQLFPKY